MDGKTVKVLSKNIAPVNVIRGKILQNVPTFDVEAATTATVEGFGTRKDVLYRAATLSGAGSITELMGPDFLATKNDPTTQKIVNDMNDAINDQIDSYFAQSPYNLTSVLTQNLGKYGADSFTFDKDEAAKDSNKILVKVDPNTNMTTLDDEGPNYKTQKEEATDWVRTNMLSKIDQERNIKTTAQNQLQERRAKTPEENAQSNLKKKAADAASMIGKLYYGNDAEVGSAIDYLKGLKDDKGGIIFQDVIRDGETGVTVTLADGTTEKISFLDANGNVRTQEDFIRSAGPLLVGQLDVNTALENGDYKKGKEFNRQSKGRGTTIKPYTAPADAFNLDSNEAAVAIRATIPKDFKVIDATPNFGDIIRVVSPTGAVFESETQIGERAGEAGLDLQDFVNAELEKIKTEKINTGASSSKKTTAAGGKTR
jgi:hypothetical protein